MKIELLKNEQINEVISLVDHVSKKYVLHEFDDNGIKHFQQVNNEEFYKQTSILTYIAKEDEKIIGMISFDISRSHICLLFVDDNYFHQGIASSLVECVERISIDNIEVNSSNYAIDFYRACGFVETDTKQVKDGIIYTPMVKQVFTRDQFHSVDEVYDFINSQKDRVYSLDNFKNFMDDMLNPQLSLQCIHICGTNGKGSTTNYIKEVLKKTGYKVATFTSPALESRLDVMRINDVQIDEQSLIKYANRFMDVWIKYEISLFEIEVFISILYFLQHNVDYAIYEVGLGGELDATNIIMPMVAVNTNIGMDHTDYLGDSYESITQAKAGIIKDGVDFITGEHKQECLDIFRDTCEKHHSELIRLDRIHDVQDGEEVKYTYKDYNIILSTPALYQIDNSALALETLLYLRDNKNVDFKDENLIEGFYEAKWAGRFEKISEAPLVIVDGAHNREGVDQLYRTARKFHNIKIIFSALKDKDTDYMLERLLELSDDVTVCEFDHPRAQSAVLLAKDYPVKIVTDYKKAIDESRGHDGVLLITGSLYFISKVRKYY